MIECGNSSGKPLLVFHGGYSLVVGGKDFAGKECAVIAC